MRTHDANPQHKGQDKGSQHKTQLQTIFEYLETHTATASMVTAATGVVQKNICRYERDLEKAGRLAEIKKAPCKVTGFLAWYLTTDKKQFPTSSPQLNLL